MKSDSPRLRAVVWAILGGLSSGCGSSSGNANHSLADAGRAPEGGGLGADGADAPAGLKANVAPGGNLDLSVWELQLPIGSPGI